jgi:secretion/DNA translocation related TadE-like protein
VTGWPAVGGFFGRGRCHDGGSGTVLVLGLIGVGVVLVTFVTALGDAVVARHRAEAAADLAVLAAAGSDCTGAAAVAAANGGTLTACSRLPDGSCVVRVAVPVALASRLLPAGERPLAHADARAGPPELVASAGTGPHVPAAGERPDPGTVRPG